MKVRRHLIFYGRVQEVGFRYYSVCKARELGLTGWVKNLPDGRVEMEVQGQKKKIGELITFLERQLYIMITGIDETEMLLEDEQGFEELTV